MSLIFKDSFYEFSSTTTGTTQYSIKKEVSNYSKYSLSGK